MNPPPETIEVKPKEGWTKTLAEVAYRSILVGLVLVMVVGFICLGYTIHKMRRAASKMTPQQADRLQCEVMAATLNAAQTNWTVIVVPRGTNQ